MRKVLSLVVILGLMFLVTQQMHLSHQQVIQFTLDNLYEKVKDHGHLFTNGQQLNLDKTYFRNREQVDNAYKILKKIEKDNSNPEIKNRYYYQVEIQNDICFAIPFQNIDISKGTITFKSYPLQNVRFVFQQNKNKYDLVTAYPEANYEANQKANMPQLLTGKFNPKTIQSSFIKKYFKHNKDMLILKTKQQIENKMQEIKKSYQMLQPMNFFSSSNKQNSKIKQEVKKVDIQDSLSKQFIKLGQFPSSNNFNNNKGNFGSNTAKTQLNIGKSWRKLQPSDNSQIKSKSNMITNQLSSIKRDKSKTDLIIIDPKASVKINQNKIETSSIQKKDNSKLSSTSPKRSDSSSQKQSKGNEKSSPKSNATKKFSK